MYSSATIDSLDLASGHRLELGGEIKDQAEATQKLFGLLPIVLVGIVVLLVGQFNSFRSFLSVEHWDCWS